MFLRHLNSTPDVLQFQFRKIDRNDDKERDYLFSRYMPSLRERERKKERKREREID